MGLGHIGHWTQWAVDTASFGYNGPATHWAVDTAGFGHEGPWTHWAVDTARSPRTEDCQVSQLARRLLGSLPFFNGANGDHVHLVLKFKQAVVYR